MDKTAIINSLISLRNNFEFGWFQTLERKNSALDNFNFGIENSKKKLEGLKEKETLTSEEQTDKDLYESDIERYTKFIGETIDYDYRQEFENLIHDVENNTIGIETLIERIDAIKARGQGIDKIDEFIELRFEGLDALLGKSKVDTEAQKKAIEEVDEVIAKEPEKEKQKAQFEQPKPQLRAAVNSKSGIWAKWKRCILMLLAFAILPPSFAIAAIAAVVVKDAAIDFAGSPPSITPGNNRLIEEMIIDETAQREVREELVDQVQEELGKNPDELAIKSQPEHSLVEEPVIKEDSGEHSLDIGDSTKLGESYGESANEPLVLENGSKEEIEVKPDVLDGLSKDELLEIRGDLASTNSLDPGTELVDSGPIR